MKLEINKKVSEVTIVSKISHSERKWLDPSETYHPQFPFGVKLMTMKSWATKKITTDEEQTSDPYHRLLRPDSSVQKTSISLKDMSI